VICLWQTQLVEDAVNLKKEEMMRIIIPAIMIAVLAQTMSCYKCEQTAEKAVEKKIKKETGEEVDIDIGRKVDLSKFPSALIYPGAKAKGKTTITTPKGRMTAVNIETRDRTDKVLAYYGQLKRKGWTQSLKTETEEGGMYMFQKGDEFAWITISKEDNKTIITVAYAKGKKLTE